MMEYRFFKTNADVEHYIPDTIYEINPKTGDCSTYIDMTGVACKNDTHLAYCKDFAYRRACKQGAEVVCKRMEFHHRSDGGESVVAVSPYKVLDALTGNIWSDSLGNGDMFPGMTWDERLRIVYDPDKQQWRTFVNLDKVGSADVYQAIKQLAQQALEDHLDEGKLQTSMGLHLNVKRKVRWPNGKPAL